MTPQLTRFPIVRIKAKWFALETLAGTRLSYHRTISGALRARREAIEEEKNARSVGSE